MGKILIYIYTYKQVIHLYEGASEIEVETSVGPIPMENSNGKDIIIQFESSIDSGDEFWTDSNGRQMMVFILIDFIEIKQPFEKPNRR